MDSDVDRQKTFHFFCEREQDIRINVTMIFNAKIIIYQPNYFDVKKSLSNAILISCLRYHFKIVNQRICISDAEKSRKFQTGMNY